MTQSVSSLAWAASGDPASPFANVSANFATDKNWIVSCVGWYLDEELRPRGFTVDNSANAASVIITIGPAQFAVNQFSRQTYGIPKGQNFISLAGTIGTAGIQFFINSIAPTADGANQFAINQATAVTAAGLNSSAMNPIINSQFSVFPDSNLSGITSAVYCCEGWQARRSAGLLDTAQIAGIINSRYSLHVQRRAGDTNASNIEVWSQLLTTDCLAFQGQTITLGYDIVFGADFDAANLAVQVIAGVGTDQNLLVGGFTGSAVTGTDTVAKNTTGARRALTVTVPVNATQLAVYILWATPATVAAANDWFRVSRFQFDIGTSAQAYRPVPDAIEQQRCLWFYEVIGTGSRFLGDGMVINATVATVSVKYSRKRIIPSIGVNGAGSYALNGIAGVIGATAVAVNSIDNDRCNMNVTVAGGLTGGTACQIIGNNVSGVFSATARL